MIKISPEVRGLYPQAKFGVMIAKADCPPGERSVMDGVVASELELLRAEHRDYERKAALASEPLCHYAAYYKRFKKSYHVLGQLESVLLKGKSIPPVGVPVEAMFLAEVKNQLLSAGHDLDLLQGDLSVNIAAAPLTYQGISGGEQQLYLNDMYVSDGEGVLSSIIGGPDYRSRITAETRNILYFVYGVEGVGAQLIEAHLQTIASYLTKAAAAAEIVSVGVY